MAALPVSADEGLHPFVLDAKKLGSPIQTTMYGIFFEDINFGADGGLYAEMVENRSLFSRILIRPEWVLEFEIRCL